MDTPRQCYLLVVGLWLGAAVGTLKGAGQLKVLARLCQEYLRGPNNW